MGQVFTGLAHVLVDLVDGCVYNYDMEQNDLLDCIYYEASRLFCDRLVSPEEREAFDRILLEALSADAAPLICHLYPDV